MNARNDTFFPLPLPPLSDRPLVSVAIANFNYARYLPACLESLQKQTYTNWQAVVCDDGSTDGSAEVVRKLMRDDARIELIEQPNAGQRAAVNTAYAGTRGEIVCFLDSDDLFEPDKIAAVVEAFRANPGAGLCSHFSRVVDADGNSLADRMPNHLDAGWLAPTAATRGACVNVPTTSAMSFRRPVLEKLMPIADKLRRDCDGYLGMAAQYLTPFVTIEKSLSRYRVHGNNMGGLTAPTPQRLAHELVLIQERTTVLRDFLAAHWGSASADALDVLQNPQYLQAALKLSAVSKGKEVAHLPTASTLIDRHPDARWRKIWRCIFALPAPLRRRGVPLMHHCTKAKGLIQRVALKPKPVAVQAA